MGLFNFLKKKEQEPAPAITASIHTQTVEVKQRTRGELPLAEIGGYVSPSGGFVNYGRFCVTGMNSSTGRKNTKRYEAQTEADARAAAADDGLVEPMTVQVEPQIPPTDRQMDYALELEAMLPDGVCKEDVSAIISRITDEDEAAPDPGLSLYAHACGVKFSRFVGEKALLSYMVSQMHGAARGELYAYAVYRQERGGAFSDPRCLSVYESLRSCGAEIAEDPALLKSLEERDVYDFAGPNRGTKADKMAAASLKQRGAL